MACAGMHTRVGAIAAPGRAGRARYESCSPRGRAGAIRLPVPFFRRCRSGRLWRHIAAAELGCPTGGGIRHRSLSAAGCPVGARPAATERCGSRLSGRVVGLARSLLRLAARRLGAAALRGAALRRDATLPTGRARLLRRSPLGRCARPARARTTHPRARDLATERSNGRIPNRSLRGTELATPFAWISASRSFSVNASRGPVSSRLPAGCRHPRRFR